MRKFIALMLALVLALGCCSAFAATTESKSGCVTITVKHHLFTNGNTINITKDTPDDTVVATLTILSGDNYSGTWTYAYDGAVDGTGSTTGNTFDITAGMLKTAQPEEKGSGKVTFTISTKIDNKYIAYVADSSGKETTGTNLTLTFNVVNSGTIIDDPTNPDGPEGDSEFWCYAGRDQVVFEGDKVTINPSAKMSETLKSMIKDGFTITYECYYCDTTSTTGTLIPEEGFIAEYGKEYKAWAVATLTFEIK